MKNGRREIGLPGKILAICVTVVVSGLGLVSMLSQHAPARSTRFGVTEPLDGSPAVAFGLSVFLIGLLPLMMLMKSGRAAAWFGSAVGVALVISIFVGAR